MNIITVPAALHSECINIINVNCMPRDQKQFQYLECITSLQWKICFTELDSYKEGTFSAKRQLPKFQTPCCQLSKNVRREMPEIPGACFSSVLWRTALHTQVAQVARLANSHCYTAVVFLTAHSCIQSLLKLRLSSLMGNRNIMFQSIQRNMSKLQCWFNLFIPLM